MKHRIRIRVPVEKRGLFGRRKIVYEERIVLVAGKTARRAAGARRRRKAGGFLAFIDEMETLDAIIDD